jgi:hypothetical protein
LTLTQKYLIVDSRRDRISSIEIWDNGIVFIRIDDNSEVSLQDSKDQQAFLKAKYDGRNKHLVLVEPGRYSSISKEAREFSTLPESNNMIMASAVIVKSIAHRIIINFIINFIRQQNMKMRMFDKKEKAIEWLLSFNKKQ